MAAAAGPQLLALVPARGGSKGIPKKNLVQLGGVPLVAYGVRSAIEAGIFDEVFVSSDSEEILAVAARYGARSVLRPAELAADQSAAEDAMIHAVGVYESLAGALPDAIALVQCTCPFRTAADIRQAYAAWRQTGADSLMSVSPTPAHFHPSWQKVISDGMLYSFDRLPPDELQPINEITKYRVRQELPGQYYWKNGAIYFTKTAALLETRSRFGRSCAAYVMDRLMVNLDSMDDFEYADYLLSRGKVQLDFRLHPQPALQHR